MKNILVALITLWLVGCGTPGPLPTPQFYQLGDPASVRWAGEPLSATVVIQPLEASGLLDGRAVVFSQHPEGLQVGSYPYHTWSQSPARLLRLQLRQALSDSGAAEFVVIDEIADDAWRISGQLERFHRQRQGNAWAAVVALTLRVDAPGNPSPVLSERYTSTVPASGVAMPDTADAFTRAVDVVLAAFVDDLAQTSSTP